jgi:hypothetical protein
MSLWLSLALLLLGLTAAVWAGTRHAQNDSGFLWRPESITASIRRDDEWLKIGQFLNLDQALRPNEGGWMNMKIDLPETWEISSIQFVGSRLMLVLVNGDRYYLDRDNVGALSFDVLDGGGVKSDAELERIWSKHARGGAA